jgi:hypothetical protein
MTVELSTWKILYIIAGFWCAGHGAWQQSHRGKAYWKFMFGIVVWFWLWPLVLLLRSAVMIKDSLPNRDVLGNVIPKRTHHVSVDSGTFRFMHTQGLNVVIVYDNYEPEPGELVLVKENGVGTSKHERSYTVHDVIEAQSVFPHQDEKLADFYVLVLSVDNWF